MKGTEAKLLNFLQTAQPFVILICQRTYSWTGKQCGQPLDESPYVMGLVRQSYELQRGDGSQP